MQKVISINLNGNAYQLEESGYNALQAYLTDAERALASNPDRAEIIVDLEGAIADKCQKFLSPHKSVVTSDEVERIVKEMGPIDAAQGQEEAGTESSEGRKQEARTEAPPKRLFRNPDGAMIAGVCNGLAGYFAVDVAFVRIGFVLAAILTKGVGMILYVVMMFILRRRIPRRSARPPVRHHSTPKKSSIGRDASTPKAHGGGGATGASSIATGVSITGDRARPSLTGRRRGPRHSSRYSRCSIWRCS